jgi:hypothetical protein
MLPLAAAEALPLACTPQHARPILLSTNSEHICCQHESRTKERGSRTHQASSQMSLSARWPNFSSVLQATTATAGSRQQETHMSAQQVLGSRRLEGAHGSPFQTATSTSEEAHVSTADAGVIGITNRDCTLQLLRHTRATCFTCAVLRCKPTSSEPSYTGGGTMWAFATLSSSMLQ